MTMIKNYDKWFEITHNPNWLYIPDHLYRILIIGCSVSGKTYVLLNLIKHQGPDSIMLHIDSYLHIDKNRYWKICQRSIWIKVSITY